MTDQIHRYIDQAPEAISGSGGHLTTLRVARCLYNGFGLDEHQVFTWLQIYNHRLSDKWTERELMHKAKSATTCIYDKPPGWMLATDATDSRHLYSVVARAHAHAQSPIEVKTSVASVASVADTREAKRVAGELLKMHQDGALTGAEDPEARFYAQVIHTFGGSYMARNGTRNV